MSEENSQQVEKVHQALREVLYRLAKMVISGLGQSKRVSNSQRRRPAQPKGRRSESSR